MSKKEKLVLNLSRVRFTEQGGRCVAYYPDPATGKEAIVSRDTELTVIQWLDHEYKLINVPMH